MNEQQQAAMRQALEALSASDDFLFNYHDCEPNNEREVDAYSEVRGNNMKAWEAIREALAEQPAQQEPVAWMGTDIDGNPNKFRLNFFGGAIPLFVRNEDRTTIADNEKDGSPCPEFWEWLPKAYNFNGDGVFTKYNMEVAFLAGKQSVHAVDTLSERVDKTAKNRHEQPAQQEPLSNLTEDNIPAIPPASKPWVGLTEEEIEELNCLNIMWDDGESAEIYNIEAFARAIEAKLKDKNGY